MRFYPIILYTALSLITACNDEQVPVQKEALNLPFDKAMVEGAILIYSGADGYLTNDTSRINQGFLPASTFKLPNTLISLESGVIDTGGIIKWDGQERWNEDWNRDHTLRTALRTSCVPCYQQLAHRVGVQRMRDYVEKINYGQMQIDTNTISTFWLRGRSRITMAEQIELLRRLERNELPFSPENMAFLKDIMILEKTDAYTLRGKTGWAVVDRKNIGWFVGWEERSGKTTFFALNIEAPEGQPDFASKRTELAREILQGLDEGKYR